MGAKSSNQGLQGYKVNGLIFPSVMSFYILKAIDNNCYNIVENEPSGYFNNVPTIKVIETYPAACEELEGLFLNAVECLMFEGEERSRTLQSCYSVL